MWNLMCSQWAHCRVTASLLSVLLPAGGQLPELLLLSALALLSSPDRKSWKVIEGDSKENQISKSSGSRSEF